jgi:hypothetical protein
VALPLAQLFLLLHVSRLLGVRGSGELISELEPACISSDGRRRRTGLLYEVASNGHEVVVRLLIKKWTTLNQFSATAPERERERG